MSRVARYSILRQLVLLVLAALAASLMGVVYASAAHATVQAGTPVAWGYNGNGQTDVPSGLDNVVAVSAGYYHSLALKSNGTVVGWGNNSYGQTAVPSGLKASAVDAGSFHSLAITVPEDTIAPTLSVGHTADGNNGWNKSSPVTLNVTASDNTGGSGLDGVPSCTDGGTPLTLENGATAGTWTASVSGEGTHPISCTVSDYASNPATASDTVKIDTTAPSTSCSVTPTILNPAANNHKLVNITASVQLTDTTGGSGANGFTLLSVTSNQADSGLGTGDVPIDIQGWTNGTADLSGQLRAERYGGTRTYTLTYRGYDVAGNTKDCSATVTVPKGK